MSCLTEYVTGYTVLGNSIIAIALCIGTILTGFVAVKGFERYANRKRARSAGEETGSVLSRLSHIPHYAAPLMYCIIMYLSLTGFLSLSPRAGKMIYLGFIIAVTFFGLRLFSHIVRDSLKTYLRSKDGEKSDDQIDQSIRGISTFLNILIWTIGLIFVIDNIGFNISAVVTGLGIGGVAVALASQTIFRDLFNYFVIFFDQPFKIGDFIIIDDKMGTIEKIGIKTTRIKSLGGEEMILSNTDLTNGRVHNYKKMDKRRVVLNIGVVYRTTPRQVDAIPGIIREIIAETDGVEFDRAHFTEFGDSGLVFEAVYYVIGPDYNNFMDKQHHINLQVLKKFNKLNIQFAYPSRTLYLERSR